MVERILSYQCATLEMQRDKAARPRTLHLVPPALFDT
jgi:hypothetical protein